MSVYYNDSDPFVCAWLRNLIWVGAIPHGKVDERPIQDVTPGDVRGFRQCHFFAGIGGWAYALQLAGWPSERPVWTGSCPCQPFSSAARGRHPVADLWPEWRRLLVAVAPPVFFGEQVARAARWFEGVCDDVEAVGYEVGAAVLPAASVGQDHARSRIFFVGHANGDGEPRRAVDAKASRVPKHSRQSGPVAPTHGVSPVVGRLRAYGNAIVPQVAAAFVSAYMEIAP